MGPVVGVEASRGLGLPGLAHHIEPPVSSAATQSCAALLAGLLATCAVVAARPAHATALNVVVVAGAAAEQVSAREDKEARLVGGGAPRSALGCRAPHAEDLAPA